jgi:cysteine synthase A
MKYQDVFEMHRLPTIYPIGLPNLFILEFFLLKLLPALAAVTEKICNGEFELGKTFLDTSSGTWAWCLAWVCRLLNVPLRIVTDPAVDSRFLRVLEELGAIVDIVLPQLGEGPQTARMRRMHELDADGRHVLLNQYSNPLVALSYSPVAELMAEKVGEFQFVVGAVGSGASTAGVIRPYRSVFPETRLIGVDTFGSVIFGLPENKRILRGLGNSLMPGNVDHSLYDAVDWVDAPLAFAATRRLHQETGIFRGPTTGAAWWVARQIALENPNSRVVFLSADSGWRYLDDVYNLDWLHEHGAYMDPEIMPTAPVIANHPNQAVPPWARYQWDRRTLHDTMVTRTDIDSIPAGVAL